MKNPSPVAVMGWATTRDGIGGTNGVVEPYSYARDHYGDGVWCVRGPGGFYLSVPEKNLAWSIAAMCNGHGATAAKFARELLTMLERDGFPEYLREPKYITTRREQDERIMRAEPAALSMKDRLRKRLAAGWSSARTTMEDVILEELLTPTPEMTIAGHASAGAISLEGAYDTYQAMIRAALAGK